MYKNILVPVDGSSSANAAAEFACQLLASNLCESVTLLVVLSIAKALKENPIPNPTNVDEEIFKTKLRHAGREIIDQTSQLFQQKGLSARTILEMGDDPGDRIVQIAQQQNFDLIVMGNRGRSLVTELVMGSVSSKVLQNANCPVVIFKKQS